MWRRVDGEFGCVCVTGMLGPELSRGRKGSSAKRKRRVWRGADVAVMENDHAPRRDMIGKNNSSHACVASANPLPVSRRTGMDGPHTRDPSTSDSAHSDQAWTCRHLWTARLVCRCSDCALQLVLVHRVRPDRRPLAPKSSVRRRTGHRRSTPNQSLLSPPQPRCLRLAELGRPRPPRAARSPFFAGSPVSQASSASLSSSPLRAHSSSAQRTTRWQTSRASTMASPGRPRASADWVARQ